MNSVSSHRPKLMRIAVAIAAASLSACAIPAKPLPQAYCQPWIEFFVAHSPGDELALETDIAAEIAARGFHASSGEIQAMPAGADILVIYDQRWFQNILLRAERLELELRDVRTGATLATAGSRGFAVIGFRPELADDAVAAALGARDGHAVGK
jgi:hypothetical protein